MDLLENVDVSQDRDFQRQFNAFYRVRQRPKEWYREYFSYLERNKEGKPTFDTVLDHFFTTLGRYEPSFSSKLVATLDPYQPVWDSFVLTHTGLTAPSYKAIDRTVAAKTVYRSIQDWYRKYMDSEEGKSVVSVFNRLVQEHKRITDLKKIDFVLWQMRT